MAIFDPTSIFRLYASRRVNKLNKLDPVAAQEKLLLGMVRKCSATKFGRAHNFSSIKTVRDFQRAVGLRTYEDFWLEFWKDSFPLLEHCSWPGTIPFFALTSGTTTGTTKYIPFTREMMRANSRAGLDLLSFHVVSQIDSTVCSGKSLMLGGSSDLNELAPGIHSGDLSGIVTQNMPAWVSPWSLPPRSIGLMKDWEKKITLLAEIAVREKITAISGVPSWLNLFLARLTELKGVQDTDLGELLPDLQLLIHGGVSFMPYRQQYERFLQNSNAEMREVYPASEGFIAMADGSHHQGLRLCLDHGLFYEFVPADDVNQVNAPRHWLQNFETDLNYALVVSSCAGLWSYIIGDTVRFVNRHPPRLIVTGRLSYSLSVFGEHLIGEELETAVTSAAAEIGCSINDYTVGAVVPQDPLSPGTHIFLVEFSQSIISDEQQADFVTLLDEQLGLLNDDYQAHRAEGYGLSKPRLTCLKPGAFEAWMKGRGKLGGQHKVPRVVLDPELFGSLQKYMQDNNHEALPESS
ncbi:MAG: GH3 auxin-responsive promoter family protein [Desulfofustis sp.]|nr:GH3 auxin-responsive promoter family protein [Desulfofustis sp.]NNK57213.1 auxin-regulated protein [Desulfofustis sp.]